MRDRDVRNAIQAVLVATGAFDGVYLWGFPDAAEQSAESLRAVAIMPGNGSETDEWDSVSDGVIEITQRSKLVIMVRNDDKQARDETADQLFALTCNTLNGQSLAGLTIPMKTRIRKWDWRDPIPPERRIDLIIEYVYLVTTLDSFDTAQ